MAVRELVENSFPYDEPVLVRVGGRVQVTPIGELVEGELSRRGCMRLDSTHYRAASDGIEVLTLDENLKMCFRKVTSVFKHRSPAKLWSVKLQEGRAVRTTSSHNVFVLGERLGVTCKETRFLARGDRVLVPSATTNLLREVTEIDLLEEIAALGDDDMGLIMVHGISRQYPTRPSKQAVLLATIGGKETTFEELRSNSQSLGFANAENLIGALRRRGQLETLSRGVYAMTSKRGRTRYAIPRDWVHTDSVPYLYVRENPIDGLDAVALTISVRQGRGGLPAKLKISPELMRILGYFTSEGSISKGYKLSFSFGTHELRTHVSDLVNCLKVVFNIEPTVTVEHETAVNVVVNDATIAFLFQKVLRTGTRSEDKRIPWPVFNSSDVFASEYLNAYIRGDGHVQTSKRNRKITLATSSERLFTDFKYLLTLLGRHFACGYQKASERVVKGRSTYFRGSYLIYIREGLAPECDSLAVGPFRESLVRKPRTNLTNAYHKSVQKNWLRTNFAAEDLPEALRKVVWSDAGALAVKNVEQVPSDSEWVYDISVEGVERFIGGHAVALLHNSFDACEMAGTPPDVYVRMISENPSPDIPDPKPYRLTVTDNGPGVAPQHVPSAFGKVFYGSKYVLRQSRGMFGLGGTMAILYGQITTNKPVVITTSHDGKKKHTFEMIIDIGENRPVVLKRSSSEADGTTGTRVDVALEGDYLRASQKIGDYFKQTALVASYANITFIDPLGQVTFYERATSSMPIPPKETLPHPHGIDVEAFKRIVKLSEEHDMKTFMVSHFHRVGERIATRFLEFAGISPRLPPKRLNNNQIVAMVDALQRFPDFLQPDAAVLSPVGEQILLAGVNKELQPEFSTVVARPPSSYSGFPFLVEVAVVYGGKILQPGIKLFRFANRIPLLYDESSDVSFEVVNEELDWRRYHVPQEAPVGVITHICLPAYEKLLAKVDGQAKVTTIGELVDQEENRSCNIKCEGDVRYITPTRDILVPSLNPDTFQVEYVPIKRFMKRPGGGVLRITSEEGRVVHVSPEHPLLVMTPRGIEVKSASSITLDEYLIASKRLPQTNTYLAKSLDLIDLFARAGLEREITVLGAKNLLYGKTKSTLSKLLSVDASQIGNWRRHDRVPLWAYLRLESDGTQRARLLIMGYRSHGKPVPAILRLDKRFARLLGYYLSEGCSNQSKNNFVSFSFHRNELALHREVRDILYSLFGLDAPIQWKEDKAVQITVYNKAFSLLFTHGLRAGVDSYSKRVPDFVFSCASEFAEEMLDSYFVGDGYLYRKSGRIQATTSSSELAYGIFMLQQLVGSHATLRSYHNHNLIDIQGGENSSRAEHLYHSVVASHGGMLSREYRPSLAEKIPAFILADKRGVIPSAVRQHIGGAFEPGSRISISTASGLLHVDVLDKVAKGDVQFVKVTRIDSLPYEGSYYNIETERDTLPNYLHGLGIFSHNCSTRIPYKTVGKEYIADRPEIEREIRNAAREALRRLGLYLSKKGSMEAVQRKMNIYGKYLPLIAKFATDLADQKKMPRYRKLIGEGEQEASTETETEQEEKTETEPEKTEIGQEKIDEYSGSKEE
ncbi:MAG: DNA topoisomerase VI subunit B [Nitrososphaerales archaeon]|nr:DNA topoisomerase VI subunit B [Nitrososphaerales archaeon]